jgi:hypothetical protein
VFRNDKRNIFVVICDTDVAENQEMLAIAELSKKSLLWNIECVTRLTRCVPLVEQELLTLLEFTLGL